MGTELSQFAQLFKTEHDLQIALVDLFGRIPGTQRVQILQGPLEHGKDIIFTRDLLPGRPVLIACVVKNHPITGSAYEGKKSASTIMNQVRQALKNPFRDVDGTLTPVQKVYVITPYDVPREAILSIEGELAELAGRFEFLCGSELLDLFREHYASYITFRGDFFNSYLRNLISHLESEPALTALASSETLLSTIHATFAESYVEPRFRVRLALARCRPESQIEMPFDRRISREQLQELLSRLDRVSSLLYHSESWSLNPGAADWPQVARKLALLAQKLPGWWEDEASLYISKAGPAIGGLVDRSTLEIVVPGARAANFDIPVLRNAAVTCNREFVELVNRAATSWGTLHKECQTFRDLHAYGPLGDILRTDELVSRCPHLFQDMRRKVEIVAGHAELIKTDSSFTVTAPPGYGKTTFCKWNAVADARALLEKSNSVFPVYLPLHKYNDTDVAELRLLSAEVRDYLCSAQAQEHHFSRVRIYLDGLDELRGPRKRRVLFDCIFGEVGIPFPVQFIITARDTAFSARMAVFPRFRIDSMTEDETRQLVSKSLRDDEELIQEFWRQVAKSGNLKELLMVPLLLRLILSVFTKTQKLPQSRYRLYQMFVELLVQGWDRAKNVERGFIYDSELKLKLLQSLAGRLHAQGRRETTVDEIRTTLDLIVSSADVDLGDFVAELLHQGLLVQSGHHYLFAHLSFQEYLTSRDLNDPTGMRQQRALMKFLSGDEWWREVIHFYINGHLSPGDLELWATGGVSRALSKAKGREVLVRERVDVLRQMFASSHPGFVVRLPG